MLLEFAATPGSLQESFLRRKKNFIQKSLKRVEEMKNKERENVKPETRKFQRGKSEKLSRQKESFLISGRFVWGQDIALGIFWVAVLYRIIDFTFVASLLLQTGIFFNLVSQGCGELFFFFSSPLSGYLFSVVKAFTGWSSSYFHNLPTPL